MFSFNLRVFTSKSGEWCRNYNSFYMCLPLFKGPKVLWQTNNHKSNFHFLMFFFGCKSFAVNYSLKSGTHRHHQTLGFIPGDALPGLYCNCLQFLLVLGAFSLQFCLQQVKCMLNWIQVRWLTWPLHNIPLLCLKNSLVAFAVCFGSLSICTVKRCPMSSEAFGWIWADNIAWNTSKFILLLLSSVTSSINTREPVPLAAIHVFEAHQWFTSCDEPSVFTLEKTLDCWLWHTYTYLLCSWPGQLLWRGFSLPGKELFCHPPQLFSVVFQVFWCCWAHRCVLSF